ncbi:MAG: STAS domain-containing protein [bacterium]|nr:STAS domain-containing protein [bacterium]
MEITQESKNGIHCLKIEGRLDAASAADAEKTISEVITSGADKIVINLEELRYISSAGLRTLLVAAKEIKSKNGKIVICSMIESVKKIFDISGFTSIFDIEDTEAKALESF